MKKMKRYQKRFLTLLLSMGMTLTFALPVSAVGQEARAGEVAVDESGPTPSTPYSRKIFFQYIDQYHVIHTISGEVTCMADVDWDEGLTGWISAAEYNLPQITIDGKEVEVVDTKIGNTSYHLFEFCGHTLGVLLICDEWGDVTFLYGISECR